MHRTVINVILSARNLIDTSREVIRNKGAAGEDAMSVKELKPYLDKNRDGLTELVLHGKYYPQPILGKEIPTLWLRRFSIPII